MKFTMKNRMKPCLCISLAIMAIALVMTLVGYGMNLGIDFTGGTLMTYEMGGQFETADVDAALKACGVADAQIAKTGDNATEVQIRISDKENTDELRSAFEEEIAKTYPSVAYVDITRVGAVAGRDLINNAVKSVTFAAILMLLYIAVRFDFYSGLAAVIGLVHDVAIMLSFMVLLRGVIRVDSTFIAALLTIVGYSINNTIIIFDRIRETAKKPGYTQKPRMEIVEDSVANTLSRTINTSLTTLITLVALYVFGVDSIREFAFPLIVGMLAGTYSSVLLSGQVWAMWMEKHNARKASKKA